jgi:putative ABC transport system permease protein
MFKNFLKVAWRNIIRYKSFSFINILGLAIGIACSILIMLFVFYETSYDSYHEKADRIYRVAVRASIGDTEIHQTYSSAITFLKLLEEFPEIERGVKFLNIGQVPVRYQDKTNYETKFFAVDSTFFDVFTVPLIYGDPKNVLVEPNTMVISESTAGRYFGRTDVAGELLTVDFSYGLGKIVFTITGVSQDMPSNSHFHYDFLISLTSLPDLINNTGWTSNNFISYVVLVEGTSKDSMEVKLKDFTRKYMGGESFDEWVSRGNYWEYFLQPLRDIHLTSDLNGEFEPNGNITYVYIFSVIGFIILLIACINFMNLTTAKSSLRIREVGMRKVAGSSREKLIWQFMTESVFLSYIALIIGILIVESLMPAYRHFVGRPLEIHFLDNWIMIPSLIMLGLVVGFVSGSYPAFILSSFKPVMILKGQTGSGRSGFWFRNVLVILQFSISIFLIISTLVIYQQLLYFQNKELGFDKEQVLVIHNPGSPGDKVEPLKETLRNQSTIQSVSGSAFLPGTGFSNIGFGAEGIEESFTLNLCICDYDFLKTLKIKLIDGRFFSREFPTDSAAAVLNRKAVELLAWDDPLGKKINNWSDNRGNFHVIGIIEDYHYESLHSEIRPQALFLSGGYYKWDESYISVRLQTDQIRSTINEIEKIWNEFVPDAPFEYSFLDDDYEHLYDNEIRTRKLFTIFSLLAIFIACMGLYGLSSYIAEQKIREISIRKVHGATVSGIVNRLNLSFAKWVLIANIFAWPAAWFAMKRWLQNFAYRIDIPWWTFVAGALLSILIAVIITSFQTIRAASQNPAESLRYE